jgi:hypothetical protein
MADVTLTNLDARLSRFSTKLRDDLKITPPESNAVASAIRSELTKLDVKLLPTLSGESPLSLSDRLHQLRLLLNWLEETQGANNSYGQLISLNYICFVYLGDACFKVFRKEMPKGSVSHKCAEYLTDNPVRGFRNALAHGNWRLTADRCSIDFWARKGSDPNEALTRFRFTEDDLHFAHYLAVATAYAAMLVL